MATYRAPDAQPTYQFRNPPGDDPGGFFSPRGPRRPFWKILGVQIAAAVLMYLGLTAGLIWGVLRFLGDLANIGSEARSSLLVHRGEIAPMSALSGTGRIYFVPLGRLSGRYSLEEFALQLRNKYALEVVVTEPMPLDTRAWNGSRRQYGAQLLMDSIRQAKPEIAGEKDATVIGVTDAPVYNIVSRGNFSITARREDGYAIVSTAELDASRSRRALDRHNTEVAKLRMRMERSLLRDIGVLHWHLPLNFDRTSLLYWNFDPDIPATEIFASDLDPVESGSGKFFREPCVYVSYSAKTGTVDATGEQVRECGDLPTDEADESVETFEVNLEQQVMSVRHVDLYQPGPIPLRFGRSMRSDWQKTNGFGVSGDNDYDRYLATSDAMRQIEVVDAQSTVWLKRLPTWLNILQWNHWVDEYDSGYEQRMDWVGGRSRFVLARYDGEREWYLPCDDSTVCYLDAVEDGNGHSIRMERDAVNRELARAQASDGRWLELKYNGQRDIVSATDNLGRKVSYTYNAADQLESVLFPSGETHAYTYDKAGHLLRFQANAQATTQKQAAQMEMAYDSKTGYPRSQKLADGTVNTFDTLLGSNGQITQVNLQLGSRRFRVDLWKGGGGVLHAVDAAVPSGRNGAPTR
ncbi:RHS repeat domain-containing protein [Bryocella elongata]|uniref:RHS repeat domain-containing protein n=1 Tax=Bryocella elongata TaxID=863522 RepID=UPI00135732D0|nr:RHS repeat domain-containing protein [Bryocella elongata]